jgi:hypothetical protein
MEQFHGTTSLSVRRDGGGALGGDGQVTLGNIVIKATARKIRRLYHDQVLAGFEPVVHNSRHRRTVPILVSVLRCTGPCLQVRRRPVPAPLQTHHPRRHIPGAEAIGLGVKEDCHANNGAAKGRGSQNR